MMDDFTPATIETAETGIFVLVRGRSAVATRAAGGCRIPGIAL